MSLHLTDHAVDRYRERWRPHLTREAAAAELEALAEHAGPTKRLTLTRDARVWVAVTPAGERIAMAVREGVCITVLAADAGETGLVDHTPDADLLAESEATRAACLAMLAPEGKAEHAAREARNTEALARQHKHAERTLELHRTGQAVDPKHLKRARRLLGYGRQG